MPKCHKSLAALALVLAILACNAPTAQSQLNPASDLAATITALAATVQSQAGASTATPATQDSPQAPDPMAGSPEPSTPRVSVSMDTNCRTGPSTAYDSVGALLVGQSAEVVGKYSSANWWIIRNPNEPGFCWIWGQYASLTGDSSSLPEMTPPPLPTATHEPTAAPQANLVVGTIQLSPSQPICHQTFTVGFDVTNSGSAPTSSAGLVSVVNIRVAGGTVQTTSGDDFPILAPGQSFHISLPMFVNSGPNQAYRITVTLDPGDEIPESNEGDNVTVVNYILQQGSCP
jgi:hypothetical protein